MSAHRVRQGECLSAIAAAHGVTWRQLWDADANAGLRARRKDPNVLHPGDEVALPEPGPARPRPRAPLARDAVTTVVRRRAGDRPLALRLVGHDGAPLADRPYRLALAGGERRAGRTDGDGVVREEVPMSVDAATLEVGAHRWELRLGHLNPLEETDDGGVSGAQARLRNLGLHVAAVDGALDESTAQALREFQAREGLEVTGALCARTIARLRDRHGA